MKRIVYTDERGALCIVIPADVPRVGETEAAWLGRHKSVVPDGLSWFVVDEKDFPPTRELRNAWKLTAMDKVVVDLARAKVVVAERLTEKGKSLPVEKQAAITAAKNVAELLLVK
ncbi:MAG TPA: hypothetical protein VGH19_16110 [Verrucomicrobiae bacterium]